MYNLLFQPQFFTAAEFFLQKSIDKTERIEYTKTNKRNEIKTRRYGPPETGLWFSI